MTHSAFLVHMIQSSCVIYVSAYFTFTEIINTAIVSRGLYHSCYSLAVPQLNEQLEKYTSHVFIHYYTRMQRCLVHDSHTFAHYSLFQGDLTNATRAPVIILRFSG